MRSSETAPKPSSDAKDAARARTSLDGSLPAGPRSPAFWQTLATWTRPTGSVDRWRRRYGPRFTIRMLGQPPLVALSDPQQIKEVFSAPPDVLHPGEGARIIEATVGPHSVILLDEASHLEQRRLLLPAFHGEAMERLEGLMIELAEREIATWPRGEEVRLHPRLQRLTLEVVLRAVFGLEQGQRLERLRDLLTQLLALSESPLSLLPFAPTALAWTGTMRRFETLKDESDGVIFELIEERRSGSNGRVDVLTLLLSASHEDGSPMSPPELRDELVTALVAGHETTASQLAWGLDLLAHHPEVAESIRTELSESQAETYLTAAIQEIMRMRPVLLNAEPRLVVRPVEIGGVTYRPGVVLMVSAQLVHHDPDIYPQPYDFRPERFLASPPGTYTWIPFGGGRRRCLGASFAMLEMKIVLRALLRQCDVLPVFPRLEKARRRGITISPANGCTVVLRTREPRGNALGARSPALPAHLAAAT
jgi:cytochrome P450